jgi:alkaline phosphatase D
MYSRRHFLRLSSHIVGGVLVSTALTGCALRKQSPVLSAASFRHGVASGDPLADGIMLWSRAAPQNGPGNLTVAWELATDPAFSTIIRDGMATAVPERDYTIKIDVRDLSPGRSYYYRFRSAGATSAVGRARTLPAAGADRVRLAVVSCSNYPAGYFHVYREAAREEHLDAFVHLGDYLYEYGAGGYATERAEALGRELAPDNDGELLTLEAYRRRYALYRADPDLQALHAAAPCIAVWDDHEIANDAWQGGAENHSPEEGQFSVRKLAAIQAYYEWLPIRPPDGERSERIFRSFEFGGLLALHMLDTRLIGRDRPLNYPDYVDARTGRLDSERFLADLSNPERSLLGDEQRAWLAAKLGTSAARWQVLGQQVLMGRMLMPAEMLGLKSYAEAPALLAELARLKRAGAAGQRLNQTEQQRLRAVMPYNLDAWDGYPAEREKLYGAAVAAGKRIVSLAGDTHNAWHNRLRDAAGNEVGVELATSSVSSPGFEAYFQMDVDTAERLADDLLVLIEDLEYCNLHQRGYLLLTATAEQLQAAWKFVDTVHARDYTIAGVHTARMNWSPPASSPGSR